MLGMVESSEEARYNDRVKDYRACRVLGDIEGRIVALQLGWGSVEHLDERDESRLATGALRAFLLDAVRLAATSASSSDEAVRKIDGLRWAMARLSGRPDIDEPFHWEATLTSAAAAQADQHGLWAFGEAKNLGGNVGARFTNGPSPALLDDYRRLAERWSLDAAIRHVEVVNGDRAALARERDASAAASALFELRIAVICALAMAVTTPEEHARKQRLLERYLPVLEPEWLTRPMVEAALNSDLQFTAPTTDGKLDVTSLQ